MLDGSLRSNLALTLPALILVLLLLATMGLLAPSFLTQTNLSNLSSRTLPLGMVSLGEAIVLLAGRIDLAVGSIMSLSTAIMARTSGAIGWASIPLTLLAGMACGCLTAAGIIALRINPLVMSLATAAIAKGAALLILPSPGGEVDYGLYALLFEAERFFGAPLLIVLVVYGFAGMVFGWTRFGRSVYAFGSDARAAYANRVCAWKIDLAVYGISGLLAALAGIVLSIRILSGDPLIGEAYTLDAVAAAILGGVALRGGRGSLVGVLLAVIALVLINNAFNLLEIGTNFQAIAKGLVLVLALVFFMRGRAGEG